MRKLGSNDRPERLLPRWCASRIPTNLNFTRKHSTNIQVDQSYRKNGVMFEIGQS